MNNSAHSPGPWSVDHYAKNGSHNDSQVADCYGVGVPQSVADGNLIAAAPEMLDMLYTLLPYLEMAEHDECYKPGKVADVVRSVRALISKADSGTDD